MLAAVTSALTSLITMIGGVVSSVIDAEGDLYALLPIFAIGIAVSIVLLAVKVIRKIAWGA